jgi:hypothetical protein
MKTAWVLAYWGQWRQARDLRRHFFHPGCWSHPLNFASLAAANPLGALTGRLLRALRSAA